jgi:hypothetical protein
MILQQKVCLYTKWFPYIWMNSLVLIKEEYVKSSEFSGVMKRN